MKNSNNLQLYLTAQALRNKLRSDKHFIHLLASNTPLMQIAKVYGISAKRMDKLITSDSYLTAIRDNARGLIESHLETRLLDIIETDLAKGKTDNAKWYLERTSKRFQAKSQVSITKDIDAIIVEASVCKD